MIQSAADLQLLRSQLDRLIAMKKSGWNIRNPIPDLENIHRYFTEDGIDGCRAGYRFMLITPEGYYRPSAHKPLRCRSQAALIEEFPKANTCRGCYVAIRSYCDKSYAQLVREQFLARIIGRSRGNTAVADLSRGAARKARFAYRGATYRTREVRHAASMIAIRSQYPNGGTQAGIPVAGEPAGRGSGT